MKKLYLFLILFATCCVFGQNEQLAQNYFDKGDFEKAAISYEELLKNQPSNGLYFQKVIDSYQQLAQYDKADKALAARYEKFKQYNLLVEKGYNYQLQKKEPEARKYYEQALEKIKENPSNVYMIASAFERKVVLDYALKAYELATSLDPKLVFNYQTALIYGQLGNTDMMIERFLEEAYKNPQNNIGIQNQLARFMTEDAEESFNADLKKALLLRAQKSQDVFWNQYLSWFYLQQKDYAKAFVQEKAIYKRNPETFSSIVNLAQMAMDDNEDDTAAEIFAFVLENTQDIELQIQAHTFLMTMKTERSQSKDHPAINAEFDALLQQYGIIPFSLPLQLLQAHFLTFSQNNPEQGKKILQNALALQLNKYQQADVKMELGDILLYEEKYNQALIYYSQIEDDLKNDEVGHEASLKAAKTSYFKSDFEWAQKQFKELKSASSQLIANDALEYFLLINDNTVSDSTQTDLKKFARADYLLYQHKTAESLALFQEILKEHKTQEIEDVTLLRIGRIYEKNGDYAAALQQYQVIIDKFAEGIYIDEALYFSAEIYNRQLKDPEKAKPLYEKILFSHQDSIYFIDARAKFRQLRGDTNL
ncbi:hypothetical protein HYN48_04715 [Flavobacterium magnum]|uniref:Tetratricopeptide repeat-like domain-containing protein n=1 Tax=Flavobacterium magnum TaxID=2162713 RepID=A0A2S0RCG6_9FLAO|nr:tetratricopeptide repeat protein [Flavobacterium magnum]AWA29443.1 hypothetical protein HYN48_04715 [Flavobacterium magnum]